MCSTHGANGRIRQDREQVKKKEGVVWYNVGVSDRRKQAILNREGGTPACCIFRPPTFLKISDSGWTRTLLPTSKPTCTCATIYSLSIGVNGSPCRAVRCLGLGASWWMSWWRRR